MPAVRQSGARGIRWRLGGLGFGPFTGGLNVRDSANEIAPNELSAAANFTIDERGVAVKRNDCPASASFPSPPGAVTSFFYSQAIALGIIQVGSTLYKCALGGGSWTSFRTTGDVNVCSFVDFNGKVVYAHPTDGTRIYDGTTDSLANATVRGRVIAAWQNKVYVSWGIPKNVYAPPYSTSRVLWSNAGDAATWTTASDYVDVREKDDKPIMALFPSSGLLVFKEDSTYRINDSTTGSYQTIDWQTGCVAASALAGQDGRIFTWGVDGLYEGDGIGRFVNVGDKMHPRFFSSSINDTTKQMICGASVNGRIYFGFPKTSTTITDSILEFNPRTGGIMETFWNARVGPFGRYSNSAGVQIATFASGSASMKDLFTGTTRTGYSCSLTTGYGEPFGGSVCRISHALPEVTVPASAALAFGINYSNIASTPAAFTTTLPLVTSAGTQRPPVWPATQGRAFQVTLDDTASPLASLSVLTISLDALLTALQ